MNTIGKLLEMRVIPPLIPARELLAQFAQGDIEAFAVLYRTHSLAVFRYAFHMTGDRTKATEVTQDVFVWLIHHPSAFDPDRGDLAAFLVGVARQLIRQQERAERRWLPFKEAAHSQSNDTPDPGRAIDAEALRRAVAALPLRYREPVILCDLEGHSYEDAAKLMNCAVGTIRSRLHRAHELLARKFGLRKKT